MGIRRSAFILLGVVLLLGACATTPDPASKRARPVMWPEPPDPPRYVYDAVLYDSKSIAAETEQQRLRRLLTGAGEVARSFKKPLGVAARRGRIFVTDTEERRVYVFDVPRRRFFAFGYRAEGALTKPAGIAVDGRGNVYVSDVSARRVVKYDALGMFLASFGNKSELTRPTGVGVAPSGDRIYVVDTGGVASNKHEVVVYDGSGTKLFVIGTRGTQPGRFNLPVGAAVAADGTLYVLDAGNFRVQAFDRDGRFLRTFGKVGTGPGQFSRPRGIAVDREGNVYVSDAGFANVQVFNSTGRLLLALGERGTTDAPGRYRLPAGVASDETGRVYIVDQYFHKIEVLRRLSDAEGARLLKKYSEP